MPVQRFALLVESGAPQSQATCDSVVACVASDGAGVSSAGASRFVRSQGMLTSV